MQTFSIKQDLDKDLISGLTAIKLLLFIFSPFLSFIYCLFTPSRKSSYLIFFLFGIVFCWSMYCPPTSLISGGYIDFCGITYRFYEQPDMSFSQFIDVLLHIFDDDSKYTDGYNLVINWITMCFSQNFHLMFAIASIPFSYFMLKSLWCITSDKERFKNHSFVCFLILVLFIMPKDIFSVQNFRFATATWIAVFTLIQVYFYNNRKAYLLLVVTPFIHASFWFLIALVLLHIFIAHRLKKALLFFYYISVPFVFFSNDLMELIDINILPPFLSKWAAAYLSEDAIAAYGNAAKYTGTGFFWIGIMINLTKIVLVSLAPIVVYKSGNASTVDEQRFLYFFLFYMGIINFIQIVPVLGTRFFDIGRIMLAFLWFKTMINDLRYIKYFFLYILLYGYELYTQNLQHYLKVIDMDFCISNLFSLIDKFQGITSYV